MRHCGMQTLVFQNDRTQLAIRDQEARDGGHEDREIGETEESRHCKYILFGRRHREIIANNGRDVIFEATKVDFFKIKINI